MKTIRYSQRDAQRFVDILADTPRRFRETGRVIGARQCAMPERPGKWSLRDLLQHLLACQRTNSLLTILRRRHPRVKRVHPNDFWHSASWEGRPFSVLLAEFRRERAMLLNRVASLRPEDFERWGTVNGRRHSVFVELRSLALHEERHRDQIRRLFRAAAGLRRNGSGDSA